MSEKVLTAPLALIKVDGETVGKMKNLRISETFRRGSVRGIGELTPSELPALEWSGTITCEFYEISFKKTGMPKAIERRAGSITGFVDNVLLQERGVDIVIYKKVRDVVEGGLIRSKLEEHATVSGAFIDREGMDISESQISGHNQDFSYTDPILFSK